MKHITTDILIIGAGIIGLSIAKELHERHPDLNITIIEKESDLAVHASGRNSGVVHAGFYYTPDSLKARFAVEGNRLLTNYCLEHNLKINRCGKVVVARSEKEVEMLYELKGRGDKNGVNLKVVDEKELNKLEPNTNTCKIALYSPSTSTIDPKQVVRHIADSLKGKISVLLREKFIKIKKYNTVETSALSIEFKYLVNAAGLYADKVAHQFGVGYKYTLIPFKGLYIQYRDNDLIQKHVYPVPNLNNPFLGVHFTKAVDGRVKIGPTAIPAFWRENYSGISNFSMNELIEILFYEARLFLSNAFDFRNLAFEEIKKYYGQYLTKEASSLVKEIDLNKFGSYMETGIRAQLLDIEKMKLVMDFVVERGENSTHILNAVSPAFTCAFSFSKFIADKIEKYSSFN